MFGYVIKVSLWKLLKKFTIILLICNLGNICRSPIAEAVFIGEVKQAGIYNDWEIDSAAIGKRKNNKFLSSTTFFVFIKT